MKKISVFIIGLFALLIVNNVSAQEAQLQQAAAPLVPPWTRVYFEVTADPEVNLSRATLTLEFEDVYLPEKQTQTLDEHYYNTHLLPGDATVFHTRYYMGHGTVNVEISGLRAYGYGTTYFVEDDGRDFCSIITVYIRVFYISVPHALYEE